MLLQSDVEDKSGLMQRDDTIENELRVKVNDYLQELCILLAFLKEYVQPIQQDDSQDDKEGEMALGRVSDLRASLGSCTVMDTIKDEALVSEGSGG